MNRWTAADGYATLQGFRRIRSLRPTTWVTRASRSGLAKVQQARLRDGGVRQDRLQN